MKLLFLEDQIQMPVMKLPVRCVAVKTKKGVILISPIKFSSDQLQQIVELGEVTDIISPSLIHSLFMKKASKRFPNATVWAPPCMREKFPKMKIDKVLTQDSWPFEDQIDMELIGGVKKVTEVAFYLKELRTLVVCDLAFNVQHPHGIGGRIVPLVLGTYKKFAISRLWNIFMKDKDTFSKSIDNILKWDFDQVVMAHGEVLTENGHEKLRESAKMRGYIS
jgi:hypothetical protein